LGQLSCECERSCILCLVTSYWFAPMRCPETVQGNLMFLSGSCTQCPDYCFCDIWRRVHRLGSLLPKNVQSESIYFTTFWVCCGRREHPNHDEKQEYVLSQVSESMCSGSPKLSETGNIEFIGVFHCRGFTPSGIARCGWGLSIGGGEWRRGRSPNDSWGAQKVAQMKTFKSYAFCLAVGSANSQIVWPHTIWNCSVRLKFEHRTRRKFGRPEKVIHKKTFNS